MTTIATLRNPVAQHIRNHVAGIMASFGFVQDKFKNAICELSINYRHGPLSAEDWHSGKSQVAAGDRMPDATLASAKDGSTTTLFKATHGTKHNLLLLPGPSEAQSLLQLAKIADETQRRFPDVFAVQVILPPDAHAAPATATAPAGASLWIDTASHLHHQLGVTDRALFVVRPDGYIGYRAQPADGGKLLEYLEKYLISQPATSA